MVVTVRSDETPLEEAVSRWLAYARGSGHAREIRLAPLTRDELAELATGQLPPVNADELYARSEGNPFFAEQLIAAAPADGQAGARPDDGQRGGLPARLADLLTARVSDCGGQARVVLAAMSVAGRPLTEDQLSEVTGLDAEALRVGLRELVSRSIGQTAADGRHRVRHTLMAEAAAACLLPGERRGQHERLAAVLQADGEALAAEVADHWAAAGRWPEELRARLTAARAADRVFGYAEAAAHWRRAIELADAAAGERPAAEPGQSAADPDVPGWYLRAIDARHLAGDAEGAGVLAEEAYRRFAGHPDPAVAAVVRERAARFRGIGDVFLGGQGAILARLGTRRCCTPDRAAALLGPLTDGPAGRDTWLAHVYRAEADLLGGDLAAAAWRQEQIAAILGGVRNADWSREAALRAAELYLWAGRPDQVLPGIRQALAGLKSPGQAIFCGPLLTAGMRACADLAERARARQDDRAGNAALAAGADLADLAGQLPADPFAEHPFAATVPAEHASWKAERARLAGLGDPAVWDAAAKAWEGFGWPHRAGYAWWRCGQARLNGGQDATGALQAAAGLAAGHAPLRAEIRKLALRARIPLPADMAPPAAEGPAEPGGDGPAGPGASYGLTGREIVVLRLLAAGRTNAQIGAELFISPKTASVHVSNILRKLGVSRRAQAAATAERAGLLNGTRE